jgi:hypothetical protein
MQSKTGSVAGRLSIFSGRRINLCLRRYMVGTYLRLSGFAGSTSCLMETAESTAAGMVNAFSIIAA